MKRKDYICAPLTTGRIWRSIYTICRMRTSGFFNTPRNTQKIFYGMIDFTSHLVFCYAVCLRQTGQMIGYVGLMPELMDASANLEFYFFKEHRRQGFATEAIRAFIAQFRSGALFGFNGKTVIAEVVCENDPSKKLIEKLGFTKTAVGCRMRGTDGVWFVRYELPAPENEQEGQTI